MTGAAGLLGRAALPGPGPGRARTWWSTDLDGAACRELADRARARARHARPRPRRRHHRAASRCGASREAVLGRFGRLDVLVNNAALNEKVEDADAASRPASRTTRSTLWERALRVNVTGTFLCCQVLGAEMARRGQRQHRQHRLDLRRGGARPVALPRERTAPRPSASPRPIRPPRARCWPSPATSPPTGDAPGVRVNALSPGRRARTARTRTSWRATRERTPLGRMAQPDGLRGRARVPGQRRLGLHDRRQPGGGRRIDRMVTRSSRPRARRSDPGRAGGAGRGAIRLVLTDCDGVLTDGGVYYSAEGEALKRFSLRDGMGVERLREAGIATAIVTRERSPAWPPAREKLGLPLPLRGRARTRRPTCRRSWRETRPRARRAGLHRRRRQRPGAPARRWAGRASPRPPPTPCPRCWRRVHYRCAGPGGHGAFREFAEWILRAAPRSLDMKEGA